MLSQEKTERLTAVGPATLICTVVISARLVSHEPGH